jgi:hypothetical protein
MAQSAAYTDKFGEEVTGLMMRQDKETPRAQQTSIKAYAHGKRPREPLATWKEIVELVETMLQTVPGYPHLDLFTVGGRMQDCQVGLIKRQRFLPKEFQETHKKRRVSHKTKAPEFSDADAFTNTDPEYDITDAIATDLLPSEGASPHGPEACDAEATPAAAGLPDSSQPKAIVAAITMPSSFKNRRRFSARVSASRPA